MKAVSPVLYQTIKELQSLKSLQSFALAGGTNLAFRYNHRESIDIDLFCTEIIGFEGFQEIQQEVENHFGNKAINFMDPMKLSDQFTFLRFFIQKGEVTIKVDLIQNMKAVDPIETIEGLRLFSVRDIGLFKLMSASSRPAKKDIYDLYYITEEISLIKLYEDLQEKYKQFNNKEDQNIFDIDTEESVIDNPLLLLLFDSSYKVSKDKMMHSHDNILKMDNAVTWQIAKLQFRMRLRELCRFLNIEFPKSRIR
ncbi:nucleotidyl transferase AbiEii/AbiGii toxin family protein [uncultured Salegentibacter sp.]|uniref:nucleotidyl transferase AbiEii/AbiGii toxin family protein n=1 Tax=uncultured Salegentibacter sp. TaxID=259320 RepID=UPI00259A9067|nr:nucleotidyl transferase AbiEii/AbiGii toxin family protein [uncultured Salegentibacter sp.]